MLTDIQQENKVSQSQEAEDMSQNPSAGQVDGGDEGEDQVQLDSEEKAGLLLDVLSATISQYLSEGGDLPLETLQNLSFAFAEDGSVKVSLKVSDKPDEVEEFEVPGDVVLSMLEDAASQQED